MMCGSTIKNHCDFVYIIGGGSFAHEVAAYIEQVGIIEFNSFGQILYVEKEKTDKSQTLCVTELSFDKKHCFIIGIGDQRRKKAIEEVDCIAPNPIWGTVIAPGAAVYGRVGRGCVIAPNAVIAPNSYIAEFCLVNYGATIGHESMVDRFVTVSPNASIGGWCKLEEGCYIGSGADILPRVKIGAWSVIGAGAVVTKDVPPGVIAKGVPARW
jgi:sugar O-acyltransferase (sialic acid O-acetyltransferase NeuD family)